MKRGFVKQYDNHFKATIRYQTSCQIASVSFRSTPQCSSVSWARFVIALICLGVSNVAWAQELPTDASNAQEATLPRVVAAARDLAPQVAIGRSVLHASRSALVGARLWPMLNPYLEVTASRTANRSNSETLVMGTAWLPFEVSGQRSRRIAQAEAYVGIHEVYVRQASAEASAAAIRAWGRALVAAGRIGTLSEIAKSAESEVKAFRVRRDVGDTTERDAQLAEVEFARYLMLIEEAKVAFDAALGEMRRLTSRNWQVLQQDEVRPRRNLDQLNPSQAAAQSPFVQAGRSEAEYHSRSELTLASEATGPLSLILSGGHGTLGETVIGGGVGFTIPSLRRKQGERAQALAEQERALKQADITRRDIEARLITILKEARGLRRSEDVLDGQALPAAHAARRAAERMFEMGKIDILAVLMSRRDEAQLRLKHLDLAEREWDLMANWTELTGSVP